MSDVADYIGTSREAVATLWPEVVRAWAAYLRGGRYGRDTVEDLLVMGAIV